GMAGYGLFVGCGWPVRGREQKAAQVFNEAVELWTRLQQSGEIDSWDAIFLEPHGGDLGGFFLVRGSQEQISRLRDGEDLLRVSARAQLVVEKYGVVGAEM